jgi:hypothetical protein
MYNLEDDGVATVRMDDGVATVGMDDGSANCAHG